MKRALLNVEFTPRSLAGLVGWWDSSDPAALFQDAGCTTPAAADGDVVGGWRDRFAGIVLAQATAAKKPLMKLGIQNGLPVVRPDAVDDGLTTTGLSVPSGSHTFYAVTNPNGAHTRYILDAQTGPLRIGEYYDTARLYWNDGAAHPLALMAAGWQVLTWRLASGGNGEVFKNGVSQGTDAYTARAIGGTVGFLNVYAGGTTYMWAGDIGEFLIYSRAHTQGEVTRMTTYLNAKWRIW
jgi:hypothetical protein